MGSSSVRNPVSAAPSWPSGSRSPRPQSQHLDPAVWASRPSPTWESASCSSPTSASPSTRVPDADFWDAMDFYKSTLSPLKNKFAMELVTLSWILVWGSFGVKPAKIPFSAIGQHWKENIQDYDFWKEIPVHLVAELQESALKLAEQRGFCPDLVDFASS